MAMTHHERRALRAIEDALRTEDPGLDARLSEPPSRTRARRVRRLIRWAAGAAALLLLFGLVVADPVMFFCGLAILLIMPVALRCVAAMTAGDR
jgi:hypothetical protein